jgi:hypothetical protein
MILLKVVVAKYLLIPWKPIEQKFIYLNLSILALCIHVQLVSAMTSPTVLSILSTPSHNIWLLLWFETNDCHKSYGKYEVAFAQNVRLGFRAFHRVTPCTIKKLALFQNTSV